ncbi:MAG: peptide deformylase [Flavobacteriales bacterium]|nr:peptide deformylase [Flavobacteriales bacterium]NNK81448.1 peptide deformylase [Flavobacteriales bacterium]
MILPIVAYGDPVLRKVSEPIDKDYPELDKLIEDMFETMYEASGVGLAAPQIGKDIRLFIVDASPFAEDEEIDEEERVSLADFKHVFINAEIVEEVGEPWVFEEGCLSIPDIREKVSREPEVTINYLDENFDEKEVTLSGFAARIVQHEYDHIEGTLFTDRIGSLRRRLLKGKLNDISTGNISPRYKMRFPKKKRK